MKTARAVAIVPSGDRSFYLRISGLENLIFFARPDGTRLRAARVRSHQVLDEVGLAEAAKAAGRPLLARDAEAVGDGTGTARERAVLLVEEATHDLDPDGAARICGLMSSFAREGAAVLWTTQRIEKIQTFAQGGTFLRQGKVPFAGDLADLVPLSVVAALAGGLAFRIALARERHSGTLGLY